MSLFRETLKQELIFKDIRVKELAERTGISKHTIDHYLAENSSEPLAESAVKIANALNVSVEYLVTGKETTIDKGIRKNVLDLLKQINYLSDENISFVNEFIKKLPKKK